MITKRKTCLRVLLDKINDTPSEVITKQNLIHLIEGLKEVEEDQIADSYDCIANSLGLYGLKTNLNGKQYFERNYEQ
jgi:hypothetical protein